MFTWRVVVFGLVFAVIIAAAIGTIIYTGTNTYYVAFDNDVVAIYQGKPGGVLWLDPQLKERTGITRNQVPEALRSELESGKEQATLEDARRYVQNIQDQLRDRSPTGPSVTTTTIGPSTSSASTTVSTGPPLPE